MTARLPELAIPRPRTRAECLLEARPCPWFGCKHHLAIDVLVASSPRRRSNALALVPSGGCSDRLVLGELVSDVELDAFADAAIARVLELGASCSLDVADQGEHDADEVGELAGVTAGQVRRIERPFVAAVRELAEQERAA